MTASIYSFTHVKFRVVDVEKMNACKYINMAKYELISSMLKC